MKVFLCLFSLYILLLSGIPCRADDDCCAQEIAANAPHPKKEYPQPCSPFFACGACHGFVIPYFDLPTPAHQSGQPVKQAVYKNQPLPDFHASIWQPPRSFMA
jgi:hypothetical protein